MTTATIRVGYEYRDCGNSLDGLVWHIETTQMSGHNLANSADIGGWNLHVQHKYNFHSGILQKGDGNTIYLKYKPQVLFFRKKEKSCIFLNFLVIFRSLLLSWERATRVTSAAFRPHVPMARLKTRNYWRPKLWPRPPTAWFMLPITT